MPQRKYKVILAPKAFKDLKNLRATSYYQLIKDTLHQLAIDPFLGNVKKLTNFPAADYRRRIGKYRILFDIDFKAGRIDVLRIVPRQSAY